MSYNNQSKDYSNDVNTRGIQFSNRYGFDPSSIQFGFWNGFLSIKITPALEKSKQTETRVYDYEKTVSSALSVDKVAMLWKKIKDEIIPAIENNEEKSSGVVVGSNSLIVISTGKDKTGNIRPFIAIHKALNEDSKLPELSIYYEFNQVQSIDDYSPDRGSYKTDMIHSELFAFVKILEATMLGFSNITAHVERHVGKAKTDKMFKLLESIAGKLGVDTAPQKSGYSRSNVFANNSNYNNSSSDVDDVELSQLSNIDDLSSYLGE